MLTLSPNRQKKVQKNSPSYLWLEKNNLHNYDLNNLICVYKITSPSGKVYIGQTVHFRRRVTAHIKDSINLNTILYRSFSKYGILNHSLELIEVLDDKELLDEREIYWIEHYQSFFKNLLGMNLTQGGKGVKGKQLSEKQKLLLIEANKNRVWTEEQRQALSLRTKNKTWKMKEGYISPSKGIPRTEEVKQKIREANLGRKMSEEAKLKMSKNKKGRISNRKGVILTEETKQKISSSKLLLNLKGSEKQRLASSKIVEFDIKNKKTFEGVCRSKTIYQYDLNGTYITSWSSKELELNGFSHSAIKAHINKHTNTSQGYVWRYKKLYEHEN